MSDIFDTLTDHKLLKTPEEVILFLTHKKYNNHIDLVKLYILKTEVLFKYYDLLLSKFSSSNNDNPLNKKDIIQNLIILFSDNNYQIICIGIVNIIYANNDNYGFIKFFINNIEYNSIVNFISEDIFVSSKKIRQYGIRTGDEVLYTIDIIGLKSGKRANVKNIYEINDVEISKYNFFHRINFNECLSRHPYERIYFSKIKPSPDIDINLLRMIDLLAPCGLGQRALIIAPPKSGKTYTFIQIAKSISQQSSIKTRILILLVGERPEEITAVFASLGKKARIFSSDFGEVPSRHVYVVEACIEYAKRLCEMGEHVVIFLDSLTRLARAYNYCSPNTGKSLSGGLDALALHKTKSILGSARRTIEAGSITIYATSLVDMGGSKLEEIVNQESTSASNSDIKLRTTRPSIDPSSSTRMYSHLCSNKVERYAMDEIRSFVLKNRNGTMILDEMIRESKDNDELYKRFAPDVS